MNDSKMPPKMFQLLTEKVLDSVLVINERQFPVDGFLFSRLSPVFAAAVQENGNEPVNVNFDVEISESSIEQFINACHMDSYKIVNAHEMLLLAQKFDVANLIVKIEEFMKDPENAITQTISAMCHNIRNGYDITKLRETIVLHLPKILADSQRTEDFLTLPFQAVFEILATIPPNIRKKCNNDDMIKLVKNAVDVYGSCASCLMEFTNIDTKIASDEPISHDLDIDWSFVSGSNIEHFLNKIARLQEQIDANYMKIDELNQSLSSSSEANTRLKVTSENIAKDLASNRADLESTNTNLRGYDDTKQIVANKDREIKELQSMINQLNQNLSGVEAARGETMKHLQSIIYERGMLKQTATQLTTDVSDLSRSIISLGSSRSSIEAESSSLEQQVSQAASVRVHLQTELANANATLGQITARANQIKAEVDALSERMTRRNPLTCTKCKVPVFPHCQRSCGCGGICTPGPIACIKCGVAFSFPTQKACPKGGNCNPWHY